MQNAGSASKLISLLRAFRAARYHRGMNVFLLAHAGHDHSSSDSSLLLADTISLPLLILGVGVGAVVIVLGLIYLALRRRKVDEEPAAETLEVKVAALGASGPPESGATLEVYNIPMRLALLVMAPAGRERGIPPNEQLPLVVESICPNLMQVLRDHQPEFRRWPPHLSSQGFAPVFFKNVPLPGESGKNTPWCALAGRFDTPTGPLLAGLVFVAATSNSLGQIAIDQPGQWLDVLRVKTT